MKLFIMGSSACGKSPLAELIKNQTGLPVIGASEWVRKEFIFSESTVSDEKTQETKQETKQNAINEITKYSQERLQENKDVCINYIRSHYDLSKDCIIEGIRNPYDFTHLFSPESDYALFLKYKKEKYTPTLFEKGISVIDTYVDWLVQNTFLDKARVLRYGTDCFYTHEKKDQTEVSLDNVAMDLWEKGFNWIDRMSTEVEQMKKMK